LKLTPHLLKEAEFARSVRQVVLEHGTSFEDVLQSGFWVHVARRLKARDQIEVHAADGAWFARLMVRSATPLSTSIGLIEKVDFEAAKKGERETIPGYEIKFRGAAKWSAIRLADKEPVVTGLDSYEAVVEALKNPHKLAA
jgi:hypothetical protein